MKTNNQSTEGKDPQQTEDKSSLDGAACSVLRVGPKKRHLAIPEGWRVITDVPMQKGDMCALIYDGRWTPIDREDVGELPWQEAVIRNYSPNVKHIRDDG
jgi:hypothetical protein